MTAYTVQDTVLRHLRLKRSICFLSIPSAFPDLAHLLSLESVCTMSGHILHCHSGKIDQMYQPSRLQRSIKTRKIHILCSIFLLIAISSAIAQETVDSKEPRWKQLGQAYGFVLGQQSALELIEKTFPDLTTSVKEAWFAFNSTALGESIKGVEAELSKELGEKWPEYKTTVTTQMWSAPLR